MSENILDKQPSEIRTFTIDFVNELQPGETVSAPPIVFDSPTGDLTLSDFLYDRNTQVQFTCGGGTSGVTYTLTVQIVTNWENQLETDLFLRVREEPVAPPPFSPPAAWQLQAGKRYLKGILTDLAPVSTPGAGITQEDLDAAEAFAWNVIISKLIGLYEVSSWSVNPPHPLFEIWDLLASSYVISIVGQRSNIEGGGHEVASTNWYNRAMEMLRNILDPQLESDRIYLTGTTGNLAPKRGGGAAELPMVLNPRGRIFFPNTVGELVFGMPFDSSIEGFQKQLGYLSFRRLR